MSDAVQQTNIRVVFIYRDPGSVVWSHVNHACHFKEVAGILLSQLGYEE